jgi:transposase
MHLLSLPPYAPELNPVEHLWYELREKRLHKRVFDSLHARLLRIIYKLRSKTLDWTPGVSSPSSLGLGLLRLY